MKKGKFLSFAWILLICAVFLTILDFCCFDLKFYEKEYAKNDTAQVIDISKDELMNVTEHLLGYIQGEVDELEISAVIAGVQRNVFDERDTMHMVDVKVLYQNAMLVRNAAFVVSILIIAFNISLLKQNFFPVFASAFYKALSIFMMICVAVLIGAAIDFDALWRLFHRIVFTNDLWLLDPNVSVLINMVPLQFFFDLVAKIVILFIASLAAISTVFLIALKKVMKE